MLKILIAQMNSWVGDLPGNFNRMQNIINEYGPNHDLIIFPELSLCGYPPEDLLLFPDFFQEIKSRITQLQNETKTKIIFGFPRQEAEKRFNSLALIEQDKLSYYDKRQLPNDSVFQESRYFQTGKTPYLTFEIAQHRFGVLICEDIWHQGPIEEIAKNNIDSLIIINASPYYQNKHQERLKLLQSKTRKIKNYIYVNAVGGQDEIIFDGQSFCLNQNAELTAQAPAFHEAFLSLALKNNDFVGEISPALNPIAEIYQALKLGLKDFMRKNQLQKVVLGLSGGIDSALCLAIAQDTLGANNVHALIMPSPYTASMSIDDAVTQAKNLNVSYEIIPITSYFHKFHAELSSWKISDHSLTSQNLQARLRGLILMTYANQFQAMLLSTSNKSESAMGYCTLYGDMCGGYALLKDVYKTKVYELATYLNRHQEIIPKRVIKRPPSAELAPNQTDQDDLPDYAILDQVLIEIIENQTSIHILEQTHPKALIEKILKKIKSSEFKRFQAPPGPKITSHAFGKDWRMPINNQWKI
jgi:NAD+ synthase (glutamine-hydrolysing)